MYVSNKILSIPFKTVHEDAVLNIKLTRRIGNDGEKVALSRDQGMDTDAKPAAFSGCRHAGGLHRMVELVDACGYPLDEVASGLGQPNTPRMALEQNDAKVFFQRLHAGADAGLRHAERIGGVAEVQIFGDGESVN